jgi:hypothetical protein
MSSLFSVMCSNSSSLWLIYLCISHEIAVKNHMPSGGRSVGSGFAPSDVAATMPPKKKKKHKNKSQPQGMKKALVQQQRLTFKTGKVAAISLFPAHAKFGCCQRTFPIVFWCSANWCTAETERRGVIQQYHTLLKSILLEIAAFLCSCSAYSHRNLSEMEDAKAAPERAR